LVLVEIFESCRNIQRYLTAIGFELSGTVIQCVANGVLNVFHGLPECNQRICGVVLWLTFGEQDVNFSAGKRSVFLKKSEVIANFPDDQPRKDRL
jgi:hypothetical protein